MRVLQWKFQLVFVCANLLFGFHSDTLLHTVHRQWIRRTSIAANLCLLHWKTFRYAILENSRMDKKSSELVFHLVVENRISNGKKSWRWNSCCEVSWKHYPHRTEHSCRTANEKFYNEAWKVFWCLDVWIPSNKQNSEDKWFFFVPETTLGILRNIRPGKSFASSESFHRELTLGDAKMKIERKTFTLSNLLKYFRP